MESNPAICIKNWIAHFSVSLLRATALLKYKMENDPEIKDLGIQEVYQLQGGIDKYFKQFPDGGFWKGKNYVSMKGLPACPPPEQVYNTWSHKQTVLSLSGF